MQPLRFISLWTSLSVREQPTREVNLHHPIANDPIIDKPTPSPSKDTFDHTYRHHKLPAQLFVAIKSICHTKIGTHLGANAQNSKPQDWTDPMC